MMNTIDMVLVKKSEDNYQLFLVAYMTLFEMIIGSPDKSMP